MLRDRQEPENTNVFGDVVGAILIPLKRERKENGGSKTTGFQGGRSRESKQGFANQKKREMNRFQGLRKTRVEKRRKTCGPAIPR